MEFKTLSYLNEHGELSASFTDSIEKGQVIKAYQTMMLTRHVDERMVTLQRQGLISFAMSSLGEEACAVGSAAALELSDWMYPQYREAGIIFWRGLTPEEYIDHMFCNGADVILGRQMPNHFGSRALNVVTVSSPIGTKIPHAAGAGYAMKYLKEASVAIVYFGEGAASEGDFHCGLNFAAVRKTPTIFFCRNNGYAISTPARCQYASEGIAPEGPGHGVTTYRVDGNDFFAVYAIVKQARKECLEGKGPILIEAMTYRMGAHSTSDDPTRYRKEDEASSWKLKDPLHRLRKYLEDQHLWDASKEEEALKSCEAQVTEAIAKAKQKPKPPLESMIQSVYFETPAKLKEELNELKTFFPKEV